MARAQHGMKGLPCIKCGEIDVVRVNVYDGSFSCSQCDEEWTVDDAKDFLSQWLKIIRWVEMMPKGGDE